MKLKYKNHSNVDRILPGNTLFESVRCMPHEVVEIDPEHLKIFAPEDVAALRPYEPEMKVALVVADKPPEEDPEGVETGELVKLLTQANAIVPE